MDLPPGMRRFAPFVAGTPAKQPDGSHEWPVYCPFHDDKIRSASLNPERRQFHCFKDCEKGFTFTRLLRRKDWRKPPGGYDEPTSDDREPPPSDLDVERYHGILLGDPDRLAELLDMRGLTLSTVEQFHLGLHPTRGYTIPVYDENGLIVNIKFYTPWSTKGKMRSMQGYGQEMLYPFSNLKHDPLIFCEGEFDVMITTQYGFPSITRTAGARSNWNPRWTRFFKGKTIYLCHDNDKDGQAANNKVFQGLQSVAAEVKQMDLGFGEPVGTHGPDLTDWFLKMRKSHGLRLVRGKFQRLIKRAIIKPIMRADPDADQPSDSVLMDALNSYRVGEPLEIMAAIVGKAQQQHTIPHQVQGKCEQDAGPMCKTCAFNGIGKGDLTIEPRDEVNLKFVGASEEDRARLIKSRLGIPPRCPRVEFAVTYQPAERLFARSPIEYYNGNRADFTTLQVTAVGTHKTPINATVRLRGAHYPNPNNSASDFLAWDAEPLAELDTPLELTDDQFRLLVEFRTPDNPLTKMKQIARENAQYLTRIYERDLLHVACDLVWHSAIAFEFQGKTITRGWLDALVIGDTRTGKSEVAMRLARSYEAGEIVSCEAVSQAGLVAGSQQLRNEWFVTWGVLPMNDKRLVILDEAGALDLDIIANMSSLRSSGVASYEKIVHGKTPCRTRLIWMANPREQKSMEKFTRGIFAISEVVGKREDIARFDFAMTLRTGDIDIEKQTTKKPSMRQSTRFPASAQALLVLWAWTRKPEHIRWDEDVEVYCAKTSAQFAKNYKDDPPLVLAADIREKVARLAVAIAMRTFNSKDGIYVDIQERHIDAAIEFLTELYRDEFFGYYDHSHMRTKAEAAAREKMPELLQVLLNFGGEPLLNFFASKVTGQFGAEDIDNIVGKSESEVKTFLAKVTELGGLERQSRMLTIASPLQEIVRNHTRATE